METLTSHKPWPVTRESILLDNVLPCSGIIEPNYGVLPSESVEGKSCGSIFLSRHTFTRHVKLGTELDDILAEIW